MLIWCWLIIWDKGMWMASRTSTEAQYCSFLLASLFENLFKIIYVLYVLDFMLACTLRGCAQKCVYWSFGFLSDFSLASGLTAVIQEVAVWLSTACPHFEKFEAPEAWAPFSPTAAPELCLTLHTKWRLRVTNWFQLAVAMVSTLEGAIGGRRGSGCVTWPHREMPDVMWRVW